MAKSTGTGKNILRLSGMIFGVVGMYHVLRSQGISLHFIELTRLGSLIFGICILLLCAACFMGSRK